MKNGKTVSRIFSGVLSILFVLTLANFVTAQNNVSNKVSQNEPKYVEMTDSEKRKFIEANVNRMLDNFRRIKEDEINTANIDRIKTYLDAYLRRLATKQKNQTGCRFGDDLVTVLKRGSLHSPAIKEAFAKQDLPPQMGIYIAMIETEFCPCMQAPTGPLGMFQFTKATGANYGLKTIQNASPQNPDERCTPKLAAQAASLYFDELLNNNFGRNALGLPFSIAAYSAGEGWTKRLLKEVRSLLKTEEDISFWQMSDFILEKNKDAEDKDVSDNEDETNEIPGVKLFLAETHRYVPKFFAAAMIGENPKTFGIDMIPLSQMK